MIAVAIILTATLAVSTSALAQQTARMSYQESNAIKRSMRCRPAPKCATSSWTIADRFDLAGRTTAQT